MAVTKDLLLSGHSLLDYQHMFDLNEADLAKRIVTVASGFDVFNQQMQQLGHHVTSCARNYHLPEAKMRALVEENIQRMQAHFDEHQAHYLLEPKRTFAEVKQSLTQHADLFLADYEQGKAAGRYRPDCLPQLDFPDGHFDLALSSHFLFAHPELSLPAHFLYLVEMARVAKEVRIFPLSNSHGEISEHLGPTMLALQQHHFGVEVRQVSYEFQRGSNAMLRVWATTCDVTV